MRTVEETLKDLVSFDSVSSRSNAAIINYLTRRCEALGLATGGLTYTDTQGIQKTNLIAISNAQSTIHNQVELALVGHTDTVPYDPNWADALRLKEVDGKLFGRGACDTKGFIAAALSALEQTELEKLTKPLALIFTADEEIGLIGAKRLADARAIEPRYAIVGEPTSLQPIRAGKGYCLAEVTVRGREAHSAYPALGSSAIFRAARLISALEKIAKTLEAETHPAFEPAFTTLNVGLVTGGNAKNVIPGECRFTLEWRPIPGQDSTRLLDLFHEAIDAERKIDPRVSFDVDAARADRGFETPDNARLATLLVELTGQMTGTVSFGTEAAQMTQLGAEAMVLGPGNIRVAHRTDEFVPVAELHACGKVLEQAIARLCS
jgi:acetylornithine deacetylase